MSHPITLKMEKPLTGNADGWLLQPLYWIGLTLFYCGLAGLGLEIALWNETAPLVWPPAGLAMAVVILCGFRSLPALAVAAFITEYLQGFGLIYSIGTTIAVVASIALAARILRQVFGFEAGMERLKDVFSFVLIAVFLSTLLSAAISTGLLCWSLPELRPVFGKIFLVRWLGQAIGMLVLGPFLMVWFARTRINFSNRQLFEVAVWLLVLVTVGILVFSNWAPTDTLRYPLELSMFPILAWSAIRFGQRGATTGMLILSIMVILELLEVMGPDATRVHTQTPPYLWVFVGVLGITGLSLAAVLAEHRNNEDKIQQDKNQLRAFLDAMPDTAFIVNEEGRFLDVFSSSSSEYHKLGEKAEDFKGHTYFDLYPEDLANRFHEMVTLTIKADRMQVFQYSFIHEEREYWFEGRLAAIAPDDVIPQRMVVWIVRDISKRIHDENVLRSRDTLLQGVANAKNSLLTLRGFDQAIMSAVEILGQSTGVDRIQVFENSKEPEKKQHVLKKRFLWSKHSGVRKYKESENQNVYYEDVLPGWHETLSLKGVIKGHGREFTQGMREFLEIEEKNSMLFVPIWEEKNFWGIIGFDDKSGERTWELSEIAVLSATAASIGGFIESKNNEIKLIDAKEAADAANAAKGEFLAMMSHEIRTPMNAVLGFADLLGQTQIKGEQLDFLQIIQRSGRALLDLINNLLDYSKIESKGLELECMNFCLEDTVTEVMELVKVQLGEKNIRMSHEIHDVSEGIFKGDPHRLRQIILNLLNNAVKFTTEGEISLEVKTVPLPESLWEIRFKVVDTGIGIPADKIEKLFKPFSQVDSSTTRKYGGTGLGLVICKKLAEIMGGSIWVESEDGKGSTFCFKIVVPAGQMEDILSNAMKEQANEDFSKDFPLSILLAEDEELNGRLTLENLQKIGYQADLVKNGHDVLEKLKSGNYDVVLIDLQMPEIDGFEVVQQVRNGHCGKKCENTYFIAVTAHAMQEDKEKCLDAGMNDYIAKPFLLSQLKHSLVRAFSIAKA